MSNVNVLGVMIDKLKSNPKSIVFTEGTDERRTDAWI